MAVLDNLSDERIEKLDKEFSRRIIEHAFLANDDVKVTFKGKTTVLVSSIGSGGTAYGSWLVQGYGSTSSRIHVVTLQAGKNCTFSISETEAAVTFLNSLDSTYSFLVLSGEIEIS